MDCPRNEMIQVLQQTIIPSLETGVQFWGHMITQEESKIIEKVLKTSLHLIFGLSYSSYKSALKRAGLITMKERREKLILKFTLKTYENEKFKKWFKEFEKSSNTRNNKQIVEEVRTRTQRYANSPIPQMAKIINMNYKEIRHPSLSEKKEAEFKCEHCGQKFSSDVNMRKHYKYKHNPSTA